MTIASLTKALVNGHIPHGNNICQTSVVNNRMTITSVITLIKVDLTSVNIITVDLPSVNNNNNKNFGKNSKLL